jgi:biotin transport system ATP-binding protein
MGPAAIELDGAAVRLGVPGSPRLSREILAPTTLTLTEQRVCVIGANGSGKSTLARLLNGLVLPSAGRVVVDGLDTAVDGAAVRRRVAFAFTDPDAQLVMPTAAEDVALSLRRLGLGRAERAARVAAVLDRYGLTDLADVSVHALSGGQRQLLALAGVLATEPDVLVCDEPTTLLDLRNAQAIGRLLDGLSQRVVLVTHDLALAERAERVLVLDRGAVVHDGPGAAAVAYYRDLMADGAGAGSGVSAGRGPTEGPGAAAQRRPQDGGPAAARQAVRARRRTGRRDRSHAPGLFVPGDSWLHRAPPAAKLGSLVVLGLALTLAPSAWAWASGSASLAALVGIALTTRLPLLRLVSELRGLAVVVVAAGAYQWWRAGWDVTIGVTSTLLALVLAGLMATMTTPLAEVVDLVLRAARPLRRLGADPERLALAVALMLRGIPTLIEVFNRSREAARARGLERHPRALLVPSVVRTVARARRTGEALAARGLTE